MAKALLRFSDLSNPDYLIITWARFSTPLAEIGRAVYPTPHPQRSLTVDNLDPVMHRFSFFQSEDGVTLGTSLLDMDIDCSINQSEFIIYDYVVDRGETYDPVSGGDTVVDARLEEYNFYIERRAFGKFRDDEYVKNVPTGTWTITGHEFEEGDTFFAIVEKRVTVDTLPVPSSDYIDVVEIAEDIVLTPDMYRALLEVTASANVTKLTMPLLSSIPKTRVLINTHSMTGRYFTIVFTSPDNVKFMGRVVSKITLGKGEEIELLFTGSSCKVIQYSGDYRRLGILLFGRGIENNVVTLDGTLYNIADFPRLYEDFINLLPPTQIKTLITWGTAQVIDGVSEFPNKGFFGVDTAAGTFRVPDFRNRSIRALSLSGTDLTRITNFPGGFQMDKIRDFRSGDFDRLLKHNGIQTARDVDNTDSTGSEPNIIYSYQLPDTIFGTQTVPRNIGLIPQIVI
jgi:hypothetical protein